MLQLRGALGASDALDQEVERFIAWTPHPTSTEIANFLKLYPADQRDAVGRQLVAQGVKSTTVASAMSWLDKTDSMSTTWATHKNKFFGILAIASGAASAYHGYKRNESIGWGVWWFLMGTTFPVITPVIGLAQGFGKRKV